MIPYTVYAYININHDFSRVFLGEGPVNWKVADFDEGLVRKANVS